MIAFNRFGLGGRLEEQQPADPRRWLIAQFDRFEARPAAIAAAPQRAVVAGELANYLEELRGAQRGQRRQRVAGAAPAEPSMMQPQPPMMQSDGPPAPADDPALPQSVRRYLRQSARAAYVAMVQARMSTALLSPAPFVERLVHFWANHFAISIDKLTVIGMGGLLEFEAIRPHVLGRFRDMLLAVEQHPAMLLYLDQAQSIGPSSQVMQFAGRRGQLRRAGLNENLAREILELHTLGVNGGYSQADVTELARAMTGWTVSGLTRGPAARFAGLSGAPGDFQFAARIHEPGTRQILGRSYAEGGEAQARAILNDLAVHPATARHLATKLARHFAGDTPPPALVHRLAESFMRSDGDLPTLYRVLIEAPETWAPQPAKFRTPWDWSVAALRAVGTREVQGQAVAGLLMQLGQPVWRPGSPAGFDDIAASWAGPDALVRRVEAAERIAGRTGDRIDARQLGPRLLAGSLTSGTAQAIGRAESPGQGLALLLVSPEFLRR